METPARLPEMWARYERGGMEEEGASYRRYTATPTWVDIGRLVCR